jgi:hypothetical protein
LSTYIEGGQSLLISFGRRTELSDAVATVLEKGIVSCPTPL